VPWHRARLTGNREQGLSCATTGTPGNLCHAMEDCTSKDLSHAQGAATNSSIRTEDAAPAQTVGGKGTRNAAPLRLTWFHAITEVGTIQRTTRSSSLPDAD
jgi:hypothetical protein